MNVNINIDIELSKWPILNALTLWMIPKRKISQIISEAIQKDLDAWLLTRSIPPETDPEAKKH
jgi:hypothetical protein